MKSVASPIESDVSLLKKARAEIESDASPMEKTSAEMKSVASLMKSDGVFFAENWRSGFGHKAGD